MSHRYIQKLCVCFVLCAISIACVFYFKPIGSELDYDNKRNTTTVWNAEYIKPSAWIPVEDLKSKYRVDTLFPDFTISEVLIDAEPFYRLDLPNRDTYLLVNAGQRELTIHGVNQTLSFPLYTNLFSNSISPPPTLSVVDLTGDGQEELLYIASTGGTGALCSVCRIFNLETITEYSIVDIRQELNSDMQINPLAMKDGEVIFEISLRQELTQYSKIPEIEGKTLRQYTPILPKNSDHFYISLSNGELWLDVALFVRYADHQN